MVMLIVWELIKFKKKFYIKLVQSIIAGCRYQSHPFTFNENKFSI